MRQLIFWPRDLLKLGGYLQRSRAETKIHYMKTLGQRFMARELDRQIAGAEIRIVVVNVYLAFGIPVTEAAG